MPNILIDAGPLIALFNRKDRYHSFSVNFLKGFRGKLLSTWPVVTEVTHMLDPKVHLQLDFLRWIERGGLTLVPLEKPQLKHMIELTEKYRDLPMDLADSSLVVIAESHGINRIASFDSDYYAYRIGKAGRFENVFQDDFPG